MDRITRPRDGTAFFRTIKRQRLGHFEACDAPSNLVKLVVDHLALFIIQYVSAQDLSASLDGPDGLASMFAQLSEKISRDALLPLCDTGRSIGYVGRVHGQLGSNS